MRIIIISNHLAGTSKLVLKVFKWSNPFIKTEGFVCLVKLCLSAPTVCLRSISHQSCLVHFKQTLVCFLNVFLFVCLLFVWGFFVDILGGVKAHLNSGADRASELWSA